MKLILALSMLASSAFGAQGEYIQVLLSKKISESALVIRHIENKLYFQKCALMEASESQVNLQSCATIGAAEGYTKEQIEKRLEQLKKQKRNRMWIQTAYVLIGAGAGFFAGGAAGSQYAINNYKANMYAYIFNAWGGAFVGSAAGLTITLVTKNKVSDLIQGGDVKGAYQILSQNSAQVVVMKDSLSNLVQDLNFALIGIPK